ncbi:hypothetical protein [Kutzneria buriramensis]|uniref:Uncharacterized protein n=1 Tax=Kutzneria buriramensis TaxID=1045776 RepID=A0A3E0HBA9_9PSEU|nr:hypothetical protein [Kutzneria buriramensis]REH41704.1 hypothetical protein BCF44_1114 [Kutzneria buriramensis]
MHALRQCHADRATAALVLAGDPGGVIHFRDGAVVAAHSPGAPGVGTLRVDDEARDLARAAMSDAAFAIAVGGIAHYALDESADVLPPALDGVRPDRLLREAAVRLAVLAASPCPLSPYRERLVPTGRAEPAEQWREIVAHATGRRTARDIAFVLGLGVHTVTVEIARMLGEDVLAIVPAAAVTGRAHDVATLRPRSDQRAAVAPTGPLPVRRSGQGP